MPTPNLFAPAVKYDLKLRLATVGPEGSGKTITNLKILALLLGGTPLESGGVMLARRTNGLARIAVIDTEYSSVSKNADLFPSDVAGQACFDVVNLEVNEAGGIDPAVYTRAIIAARQYDYEAIDVDSLSHAWEGLLDMKNKLDAKGGTDAGYVNWSKMTPIQNAMMLQIKTYPGHVACTMRTKSDTRIEPNPARPGKNMVVKYGTKAIQRDEVGFEFDVILNMSEAGVASVGKTRCFEIADQEFVKPGVELAEILRGWLASPIAAPMQRDVFINAMKDLGVTDVGAFLAQNELLSIGGTDKYGAMLAKAREIVAALDHRSSSAEGAGCERAPRASGVGDAAAAEAPALAPTA